MALYLHMITMQEKPGFLTILSGNEPISMKYHGMIWDAEERLEIIKKLSILNIELKDYLID